MNPTLLPQLGPYQIVRRLGQGGASETWLAVQQGASGFARKVALKTLRPEFVGEGLHERAILEEGRLGGLLQHKNWVGVEELGFAEGRYFLRLPYVEGCDLGARLARGRAPLGVALYLGGELCEGLSYLHQLRDEEGRPLGLIHRDLSPENVLLSVHGEVKLCDLGIAKARYLSDQTWGRLRKGKYAYMSPEQVRGEPLGPASDIFALGVVLCELLCGQRPFAGETPLLLMEEIQGGRPRLTGAPRGLREVLSRCLQKDPAQRYPDAATLGRALQGGRKTGAAGWREVAAWVRGEGAGA